jgi:O-methyltransferase
LSRYLDLLAKTLIDGVYRPFDPRDGFQPHAYSMISKERMRDVRRTCETVIADGVPGAFVETGICRGGALMMMQGVLVDTDPYSDAYPEPHWRDLRPVFGFDSFNGVPRPYMEQDAGLNLFTFPELAVTKAQVEKNFRNLDLWGDNVHLVEGWFKDTLAVTETGPIAVLRLDGDLYSSTLEALEALYPRLSPGGFILIDDAGDIPQCAQAVDEYRAAHAITEEIQHSDWSGWWWRKQ